MSVKVTESPMKVDLRKIAESMKKKVHVGVPSGGHRDDGEFSNADIMAISEYGSPVNNIPPRPVMTLGLEKCQAQVLDELKRGAERALSGEDTTDETLNRVGMIASNTIKKVIDQQDGIEPISYYTLLARLSKGFEGDKALLVSGQFRNSITWKIEDE